jgi:hypothetical protein
MPARASSALPLLDETSPHAAAESVIRRLRRQLFVVTTALIFCGVVGGWWTFQHSTLLSSHGKTHDSKASTGTPGGEMPSHGASDAATNSSLGAVGPWGEPHYSAITLSPPLELIPEYQPDTSHEIVWHFPHVTSSSKSHQTDWSWKEEPTTGMSLPQRGR